MTLALTLSVLGASLLGSMHCAAMCGGFVCLYAGERRGAAAHLAYNGGRLVSYVGLGAIAGLAGSTVDGAGAMLGVSRLAAIVSGVLLVTWGVSLVLRAHGVRVGAGSVSFASRWMGPALARTRHASPVARAGTIGLLSTLLPCGWLYAFVATAGGTGSVAGALGVMIAFWAGTVPAMLAVGAGLQRLTGRFRTRLPLVTAVAVIVIGALSIAGRLTPMVSHASTATSAHHAR
ncbi:MAG: sulfite exporter TauE/SafE family protein [Gemmatimonadaceae bacterium]|nr:sulfite exporter TauE/SafE family protein [Gemmatimonadaceae bacterium]